MASGGCTMRAAAKVAGIGISNLGFRGLPENFTVRKAFRPSASVLSPATIVDDSYSKVEIAADSSQSTMAFAWDLDDWDFAGYEVEEKPRLVFLLLMKPRRLPLNSQTLLIYSKSELPHEDTSTCVLDQNSIVPSVPNHAFQAFKLLKENSAAQTVVASIAADPNVWNAVLQNEALREYLESEKKIMEDEVQEQVPERVCAGNSGSLFTDIAENVKLTVARWVNNMSALFYEFLRDTDDLKTSSGPANWSPTSTSVCGTLFALASMVVMLVALRRLGYYYPQIHPSCL